MIDKVDQEETERLIRLVKRRLTPYLRLVKLEIN